MFLNFTIVIHNFTVEVLHVVFGKWFLLRSNFLYRNVISVIGNAVVSLQPVFLNEVALLLLSTNYMFHACTYSIFKSSIEGWVAHECEFNSRMVAYCDINIFILRFNAFVFQLILKQ